MAKAQKIRPEQIESARKMLQALPAKDTGVSKEEAARMLAKEILDTLKKGYTMQEVKAIFRQEGLAIPVAVMQRKIPEALKKTPIRRTGKKSEVSPEHTSPHPEQHTDGENV